MRDMSESMEREKNEQLTAKEIEKEKMKKQLMGKLRCLWSSITTLLPARLQLPSMINQLGISVVNRVFRIILLDLLLC